MLALIVLAATPAACFIVLLVTIMVLGLRSPDRFNEHVSGLAKLTTTFWTGFAAVVAAYRTKSSTRIQR